MFILNSAIILFVFLEILNVMILYFSPDSKIGNGVAVFNPWFKLKTDQSNILFAKYLINWVAGTKLIFIGLLLVIVFTGGETTKLVTVMAMPFFMGTYYFRLHPIIKKLDDLGEITPKGYSKTLSLMIICFMILFTLAGITHIII